MEVNLGDIQVCPSRHRHRLPFTEGFETKLKEPLRFILLRRNEPNDIFIQSCRYNFSLHIGSETVLVLLFRYVLDQFVQNTNQNVKIKAAHFRAAWRPVAESNRSIRFCRPLTKSLIQPAVAFGNKIARVYTTPLNKRATCASALPKNRQISGGPERLCPFLFLVSGCKSTAFF